MPARPDTRGRFAPILLVLLGIGFLGFVAWLLDTRVGGGDIYPVYSTLRADPRGCKALFLAVDALPGYQARRNFRPWHRLRPENPSTIIALGGAMAVHAFPDNEQIALKTLIEAGHRIVLTVPVESGFSEWLQDVRDHPQEKNPAGKDDKPEGPPKEEKSEPAVDKDKLADAEKVLAGLKIVGGSGGGDDPAEPIESPRFPGGQWRGEYHFTLAEDDKTWTVDGMAGGHPVIVSRRVGAGELVVVADTSFATNEMLRADRQSQFLLSLLGDHNLVIFDERALGTTEEPGVATLVRQLGLHGLVVGAVLMLVLLAWQGLCPLVPPSQARETGVNAEGATSGRDATDGLVALLRRGLPARLVLGDGIDRWLRTRGHGPAPAPDDVARARDLAATAKPGHIARVYLDIRNLLNRPKSSSPKPHHGSH